MTTTTIDWQSIPHKVPPRNEKRVLVEVDVDPVNGASEFCQIIPQGKHVVLLYESELAQLEKLTQDDEEKRDWATAVKQYESALARHLEPIKDERARKLAEESFGFSPSYYFSVMRPGGKRPFRSFRVLERNIPAPETPSNLQDTQFERLTEVLAKLVGAAQQPAKAR